MAAPRPGGGPSDGWNDPPLFTYNPAAQGAPSQRTHLNKRVSFPLTSSINLSDPILVPQDANAAGDSESVLLSPQDGLPILPPVQILPPSMSTSVHPPVPLVLPSMNPPIDSSGLPPSFVSAVRDPLRSETLPELLERLELDSADALRKYTKKIFHEIVDVCKDSIQGRSKDDVQTRLGLLDDQWREEKLSEGAKTKLGCLASALKNNDLKQADSLHLALMVDHISEVSQWMVGVKRLINELKLLQAPPLPSFSPKRLNATSSSTPAANTATAEDGETKNPSEDDVCVDTAQFCNLKPVLMPEMLVVPDLPEDQGAVSENREGSLEPHKQEEGKEQEGTDVNR